MKALRVARAEAGLTLVELAERSGVSRHTIRSIERGAHKPQEVTLAKIARALGRPVSEFLEEETEVPKVQAPPEKPPSEERRTQHPDNTWSAYLNQVRDRWTAEIREITSRWERLLVPDLDELAVDIGRIKHMWSTAEELLRFATYVLVPRRRAWAEMINPSPEEVEALQTQTEEFEARAAQAKEVSLKSYKALQMQEAVQLHEALQMRARELRQRSDTATKAHEETRKVNGICKEILEAFGELMAAVDLLVPRLDVERAAQRSELQSLVEEFDRRQAELQVVYRAQGA